jgi:hypothetical protein
MSGPLSVEEQLACLSRCIAHKEYNFDAAITVLLNRIDALEARVEELEVICV